MTKLQSPQFDLNSYINSYASADMLVLAGQGWHESIDNDDFEEYTYLIGFGLSSSTSTIPATPLATGIVNGYLLNQFALDWYEDHLRIATTTSEKWGRITLTGADGVSSTTYAVTAMSESQVMVLALEGTQFKEVGRVEELGVDEVSCAFLNRYLRSKKGIYLVLFLNDHKLAFLCFSNLSTNARAFPL